SPDSSCSFGERPAASAVRRRWGHPRPRASKPHDVHVRFAPKASEIAVLPRIDTRCHNQALWLYSRGVNEAFFAELSAWLTQAGLAGTSETDIVSGFCDRCVPAGPPLARALMFVHP